MQYSFGAAAKGARDPAEEENKTVSDAFMKPATKPVFKGKAKLNLGGASNEEVQNSRMNYDFSKMNMSAATAKKAEGAEFADGEGRPAGQRDGERRYDGERRGEGEMRGGYGERRGGYGERREDEGERRAPRPAPVFKPAFEDDFEVVEEKKKVVRPPRNFEEPKFGGGMPSFTRGGATRPE